MVALIHKFSCRCNILTLLNPRPLQWWGNLNSIPRRTNSLCAHGTLSPRTITMSSQKRKYYAVVRGRHPGLYGTWESCEQQVKGYSDNLYKGFASKDEAQTFLKEHGVDSNPVKHLDRAESAVSVSSTGRLEFDGASRRNPGPSGFGAVIYDDDTGNVVKELTGYIGDENTNNQAEYAGLVAGLHAMKGMGFKKVKVRGDSKLVIHQVLGKWAVKNDILKKYHEKAMALIESFESFEAEHVLREFNKEADRLSNVAIDEWLAQTCGSSEVENDGKKKRKRNTKEGMWTLSRLDIDE
mmetsp:Transcript_534/g.1256  ORF Transcript_534/g.1256 Transcript_534/m.1256 type:complete len:296 (-) Transcript_534:131-1018(-)